MTSYFSERTAEYSILPPLVAYLAKRFGRAAPMYYWSTREGNTVAREVHANQRLRVLAVFARRPKVWDGSVIRATMNPELFDFAHRAKALGIPTVAGLAAVANVFELGQDCRTLWLALDEADSEGFEFHVDLSSVTLSPARWDGKIVGTLQVDDLGDAVEAAPILSWRDAMVAIGSVRRASRVSGFQVWGGSFYTPAYIVVPD